MKRAFYFAIAALIVAGATSCKKSGDVQESTIQPTGKMREVVIAAGQGSQKTSVNAGNLVWSSNDKIYLVPQSGTGFSPATFNIVSGMGGATGTFKGDLDEAIEDNTQLYSYTGGDWTYSEGTFIVNMSETQEYVANGLAKDAYPSIGAGSIDEGVSFSNPFGLLKLNVKGNISAKSISVTSASKNLAGAFTVNPSSKVVTGGSSNSVTITFASPVALSESGSLFYAILPPSEYAAGDLTVRVISSDDKVFSNLSLGAVTITLNSVSAPQEVVETVGDACDINYKLVTIGAQVWTAENIRCNKYSASSDADAALKGASYTIPVNSPAKGSDPYYRTYQSYGYYYSWAAAVGLVDGKSQKTAFANKRQGICPDGFHVPTNAEWNALVTYIDGSLTNSNTAGKHLKSKNGWKNGGNGDDKYGFNGLPGGIASTTGVTNATEVGVFWGTDPGDSDEKALTRGLAADKDEFTKSTSALKANARNVRCLKN